MLKAWKISSKVGSEEDAGTMWADFLKTHGYSPVQAFPPNTKAGTSRIAGDAEFQRKSSILNHLFKPTWKSHTYYAKTKKGNIPLYTKTRGIVAGTELRLWSGFQGIRDLLGDKIPDPKDDKKTISRRKTMDVESPTKTAIEAIEIIDEAKKKNPEFTGNKPPTNWASLFAGDVDAQEEWLEENYPDYHKYLVETLHKPTSAESTLDELVMTPEKARLLRKIESSIKRDFPKLSEEIYKEHVELDNNKWIIVIFANNNLKPRAEGLGFVNLFAKDYFQTLQDSDEVSDYMKKALQQLQSEEAKLTGADSEYFIRAPQGKKIKPKVSKWLNKLKRSETVFDDIKKENSDWYELLKAKKDDEKGSSKKPIDPDNEGNIRDRKIQDKELWSGDWEKDENMKVDPTTNRKRTAPESEKARGRTAENTTCCIIIKEAIADFIQLSKPAIMNGFGRPGIRSLIDENLPCMDMEREWNLENESLGEIVFNFNGMETLDGDYFEGDGTVVINPLEPAPFDKYAGQLTLLPKQRWQAEDIRQGRDVRGYGSHEQNYGGPHLTLVQQFLRCEEGQMSEDDKKPLNLRTGDEADVLDAFSDKGLDEMTLRRLRKKIAQIWVQRYGGRDSTPAMMRREEEKMKRVWPHGHAIYFNRPGQQKLDSGQVSLSEKTEEEFTRERVDDYLDEILRWKKSKKDHRGRLVSPKVDRDYLRPEVATERGIPDPKGSGRKPVIIWVMLDTDDQKEHVNELKGEIALNGWADKIEWKEVKDADDTTVSEINKLGVLPVLQHGTHFVSGKVLGAYLEDLFG